MQQTSMRFFNRKAAYAGGQLASVDYENQVSKSIPVEAKSTSHLKQLSSYMDKLSTCAEIDDRTVGVLLTEDNFHIAFVPYKWKDTNKQFHS